MRSILAPTFALLALADVYDMIPDRSADVFLLFDAETDPDVFYFATNKTTEQVAKLYEVYEKAGFDFAALIGVAWMPSVNNTCLSWKYRADDADDFLVKANDLLANSTVGIVGDDTRRGAHGIARMVQLELSKSERRRVIVYFSDKVEAFGNYTGDLDLCPKSPIAASTFTSVIEEEQVGLLYVTIASDWTTGDQLKAEAKSVLEVTGLTDMLIDNNEVEEKYKFDAIDLYLRQMLSPAWIASTTTTLSPIASAIKECVAEKLKCTS